MSPEKFQDKLKKIEQSAPRVVPGKALENSSNESRETTVKSPESWTSNAVNLQENPRTPPVHPGKSWIDIGLVQNCGISLPQLPINIIWDLITKPYLRIKAHKLNWNWNTVLCLCYSMTLLGNGKQFYLDKPLFVVNYPIPYRELDINFRLLRINRLWVD